MHGGQRAAPMTEIAAPPGGIRLREAVAPADADGVADLVAATGFFSPAEVAIARELVEEHLAKGAASGYWFLFADRGATLVGYACFGPVPATASSFDLYWIAVAPPWQGQGIGRVLLDRMEWLARAAGGERLYAETSSRPGYASTRAFYMATGFSEVAFLPEHFGPGDGKRIFEKRLTGPQAH